MLHYDVKIRIPRVVLVQLHDILLILVLLMCPIWTQANTHRGQCPRFVHGEYFVIVINKH